MEEEDDGEYLPNADSDLDDEDLGYDYEDGDVLHEFQSSTESPRELQWSFKDVAEENVVCGILLKKSTYP